MALEVYWQTLLGGKVVFDAARQQGVGRVSKSANSVAASAYTISQNTSSIMGIVKIFGCPHVNMAIEIICFVCYKASVLDEAVARVQKFIVSVRLACGDLPNKRDKRGKE